MKHVIIDTDAGGDCDDIFAILLAINSPEIKVDLIVTSDEHKADRVRYVKKFLRHVGKEIPVVCGIDLGNERCFAVSSLVDKKECVKEGDFLETATDIISRSPSVHYVCIGPQSNLAELISKCPQLKDKLKVFIMGGGIDSRIFKKVEHNVRYDVKAAKTVFESDWDKRYVLGDITRTEKLRVTGKSGFYGEISESREPHIEFLKESVDCWLEKSAYPYSHMNDPLTMMAVFDERAVTFEKKKVSMHGDGGMAFDRSGKSIFISTAADYELFWKIFRERIFMRPGS